MTINEALHLAQQAGLGDRAKVRLHNTFLGNARNAMALRKAILRRATPEQRALFESQFEADSTLALTRDPIAWQLLLDIAADSHQNN